MDLRSFVMGTVYQKIGDLSLVYQLFKSVNEGALTMFHSGEPTVEYSPSAMTAASLMANKPRLIPRKRTCLARCQGGD
jgi:hypothetical protein